MPDGRSISSRPQRLSKNASTGGRARERRHESRIPSLPCLSQSFLSITRRRFLNPKSTSNRRSSSETLTLQSPIDLISTVNLCHVDQIVRKSRSHADRGSLTQETTSLLNPRSDPNRRSILGPQRTSTHEPTIHWMPIITRLWMKPHPS
jgi:hypothetical protein